MHVVNFMKPTGSRSDTQSWNVFCRFSVVVCYFGGFRVTLEQAPQSAMVFDGNKESANIFGDSHFLVSKSGSPITTVNSGPFIQGPLIWRWCINSWICPLKGWQRTAPPGCVGLNVMNPTTTDALTGIFVGIDESHLSIMLAPNRLNLVALRATNLVLRRRCNHSVTTTPTTKRSFNLLRCRWYSVACFLVCWAKAVSDVYRWLGRPERKLLQWNTHKLGMCCEYSECMAQSGFINF